MLTVFHTADWHLGQSFFGFDRDFEHAAFLEWLLQELQSQQPEAMLLAGDVFDTINPSAQSLRRYYDFLARAHALLPELQIVITAGNHDAGARLEAPSELLNSLHVSIVGTVSRDEQGTIDLQKFLVPLKNRAGLIEAIILAVPFLRPSDVPLLTEASDPYLDGVRELYRQATNAALQFKSEHCPNAAIIAMGHCHLTGGQESLDSERRLVIGGAEALNADTFAPEVAYVALGHLHKPQHFRDGSIRYCGSPIPLSFAETGYDHQVLRLKFDHGQLHSAEAMQIPRSASLRTVPTHGAASIDDLLPQLTTLDLDGSLPPEQHPFLEVRVLEDQPDPTRRKRIEEALEGKPVRLASIKVESASRRADSSDQSIEQENYDLKTINPEEIFLSAHLEKYGAAADEALINAFREILLQEVQAS
jgi:exonuclease SbcD